MGRNIDCTPDEHDSKATLVRRECHRDFIHGDASGPCLPQPAGQQTLVRDFVVVRNGVSLCRPETAKHINYTTICCTPRDLIQYELLVRNETHDLLQYGLLACQE